MMRSINYVRNVARYCDLYGPEILKKALLDCFYDTVSYRENSIPSEGSPCRQTKDLRTDLFEPVRAILHKTPSITIEAKTNEGKRVFLRFWRDMVKVREYKNRG